jgi:hypothetical protein
VLTVCLLNNFHPLWDNRMKSQIISKSLWASILKSLIGKSKFTTVTYVQDILILDLIVHSSFIIIVLVLLLVQVCMLVFVSIICLSWYECVWLCWYDYFDSILLYWCCVFVLTRMCMLCVHNTGLWCHVCSSVLTWVLCHCVGVRVSIDMFVRVCADMSIVPLCRCACFYDTFVCVCTLSLFWIG